MVDPYLSDERIADFQFLEVLGSGSFGVVRKCRSNRRNELFAIKECKKNNNINMEVFDRENTNLQEIKHKNIVQYIEYLDYPNVRYIVLELMEGCLKMLMENTRDWSFPEVVAASVLQQICDGLHYLHHKKHTMHRDIKPSNILYNLEGI